MGWLFSIFTSLGIGPIIAIALIILYIKQRKGQEYDIPPLDLVDAKKLDDMISRQVEEALDPILRSEDYSQEQINQIFRR